MSEKNIVQSKLQEIYKDKLRFIAILLIFLSSIFFMTMLIGGSNGSVFLNKFTFEEGIAKLLQRDSIKFTMLGYCVDDKCTKDVGHDFDKAPTSSEIQTGEINKRSIVVRDFNPGDVVDDAKDKVDDVAQDVGEKAGEVDVGEAADTVAEEAQELGEKAGEFAENLAKEALRKLLEAFDNFSPKESTDGISGWIAKPIIAAVVFNFVALLLLFFINQDNATILYFLSIVLLLVSIILNLASLITTSMLFSLVFNVIGAFPGIGDNDTGSANGLSICSLLFLIIALMCTIARSCSSMGHKAIKKNSKGSNEASESNV
jgi:hypothetical protein